MLNLVLLMHLHTEVHERRTLSEMIKIDVMHYFYYF